MLVRYLAIIAIFAAIAVVVAFVTDVVVDRREDAEALLRCPVVDAGVLEHGDDVGFLTITAPTVPRRVINQDYNDEFRAWWEDGRQGPSPTLFTYRNEPTINTSTIRVTPRADVFGFYHTEPETPFTSWRVEWQHSGGQPCNRIDGYVACSSTLPNSVTFRYEIEPSYVGGGRAEVEFLNDRYCDSTVYLNRRLY